METINSNHIFIAYGFEYNKIIINDLKCCIAKSIITKNPIYCSLIIKDREIQTIINKINLMKYHYEDYLLKVDKLAKSKHVKPKWQLVYYDKDFEHYLHSLQGKKYNYDLEL